MKHSTRCMAFLLVVSLMLGLLCFSAVGAGLEGFEDKVSTMLSATTYPEKKTAYTEALAIYEGLSAEEKNEVKTLELEMQRMGIELENIEKAAEAFDAQVRGISDIAIGDRMVAIESAEAKANAEIDPTHPIAFEALKLLAEMKSELEETIENCLDFMSAVSDAEQLDVENYIELREALDLAATYLDVIDTGYPGVSGAYSSYSSMSSELGIKERYTAGVLAKVNEMINAKEYATRRMLKNEIDNLLVSESFIPDYEGMQQALATMAEVEEEMKACVIKATRFILAVEAVATADNYREALIGCYAFIEGVDFTVDGAAAAKASFDGMVNAYNSSVRYCNSFMSGK